MNGFDTSELDRFSRDMLALAERELPKEAKKFLRKEGTKLKKKTRKEAREKVNRKTGKYMESIRRGKVYKYKGSLAIRAYSSAPYAHFVEGGHRMITHDGREVGFIEGKHVFENARRKFEREYLEDCKKFVDEVMNKL